MSSDGNDKKGRLNGVDLVIGSVQRAGGGQCWDVDGEPCVRWMFHPHLRCALEKQLNGRSGTEVFAPEAAFG